MRVVALLVLFACGCTKPNPNLRCCETEADCAALGISEISHCTAGELCRGNKCVIELCDSAQVCDPSAPYCVGVPDGTCQESCSDDSHCPGSVDAADRRYCESGACVACRDDEQCPSGTPVCDSGSCRACQAHTECGSGFCGRDGECVDISKIAVASPNGSSTSMCDANTPCSLARALELTPRRTYVKLTPGVYQHSTAVQVYGDRHLLGVGASRPVLRRSEAGPIIEIGAATDATFEYLEISGARSGTNGNAGVGISSPPDSGGSITRIIDSIVAVNDDEGYSTRLGAVVARRSVFRANRVGVSGVDASLDIDACEFMDNQVGVFFDYGKLRLTNSFLHHNQGDSNGALSTFQADLDDAIVEHNTIVHNREGLSCSADNSISPMFANNIIAANMTNKDGSCSTPGSIVLGSDISSLKFKSPDSAPYDYRLLPGSAAIDAATGTSTLATDFDGEVRPRGAARDVGADEAE